MHTALVVYTINVLNVARVVKTNHVLSVGVVNSLSLKECFHGIIVLDVLGTQTL